MRFAAIAVARGEDSDGDSDKRNKRHTRRMDFGHPVLGIWCPINLDPEEKAATAPLNSLQKCVHHVEREVADLQQMELSRPLYDNCW